MYWLAFLVSFYGGLEISQTEINYSLEGTKYNNYRSVLNLFDINYRESLPEQFTSYGAYGGVHFNEEYLELSYTRSERISAVFQIPDVGLGQASGRIESWGLSLHSDKFTGSYGPIQTNTFVSLTHHDFEWNTRWHAIVWSEQSSGSESGLVPGIGIQFSVGDTSLRLEKQGNWVSSVDNAISIRLRTEF